MDSVTEKAEARTWVHFEDGQVIRSSDFNAMQEQIAKELADKLEERSVEELRAALDDYAAKHSADLQRWLEITDQSLTAQQDLYQQLLARVKVIEALDPPPEVALGHTQVRYLRPGLGGTPVAHDLAGRPALSVERQAGSASWSVCTDAGAPEPGLSGLTGTGRSVHRLKDLLDELGLPTDGGHSLKETLAGAGERLSPGGVTLEPSARVRELIAEETSLADALQVDGGLCVVQGAGVAVPAGVGGPLGGHDVSLVGDGALVASWRPPLALWLVLALASALCALAWQRTSALDRIDAGALTDLVAASTPGAVNGQLTDTRVLWPAGEDQDPAPVLIGLLDRLAGAAPVALEARELAVAGSLLESGLEHAESLVGLDGEDLTMLQRLVFEPEQSALARVFDLSWMQANTTLDDADGLLDTVQVLTADLLLGQDMSASDRQALQDAIETALDTQADNHLVAQDGAEEEVQDQVADLRTELQALADIDPRGTPEQRRFHVEAARLAALSDTADVLARVLGMEPADEDEVITYRFLTDSDGQAASAAGFLLHYVQPQGGLPLALHRAADALPDDRRFAVGLELLTARLRGLRAAGQGVCGDTSAAAWTGPLALVLLGLLVLHVAASLWRARSIVLRVELTS